jgi:hypothetical protein
MPGKDFEQPIILPHGIAAPDGDTGYFAAPPNCIEALDLVSGERVWSSEEGCRPVAALGKRLAAERVGAKPPNELWLVVLDASSNGRRLLDVEPIVLPSWATVSATPSESFDYRVELDRPEIVIYWEARSRYLGGAPPPPQVKQAAATHGTGAVRVNLESGRVRHLQAETPASGLPERFAGMESAPYKLGTRWREEAWVVEDAVAALVGSWGDTQSLALQTWDRETGDERWKRALIAGRRLFTDLTPDGRYLFIRDKGDEGRENEPWHVFSVIGGEQVARLRYEHGAQWVCVVGERVYYCREGSGGSAASKDAGSYLALISLDLRDGRVLWEAPMVGPSTSGPHRLRE